MRIFGIAIRRALDSARRAAADLSRARRWLVTFAIAASLLMSALGPAAPVRADPPPDPAARLQIIIHKMHIFDDTDPVGAGEERFNASLCADDGTQPYDRSYVCAPVPGMHFVRSYDASTGADLTPEYLMPQEGDELGPDGSGVPVFADRRYVLYLDMFDRDPLRFGNTMGEIFVHVDEEHNWGLGTFTIRSTEGDGSRGDYDVTFEIRRAPLSDLQVSAFEIAGTPGSEYVCGQIQNVGQRASGPIPLALRTEGTVLATVTLSPLEVGANTWHCIERSSLPAKKHNLVFSLDDARQVPEMEEYNNINVTTVEASPSGTAAGPEAGSIAPTAMPSPQPKPNGGQTEQTGAKADLTVKAIQVNGQQPDGKNDCKSGKNSVTVIVKNGGKADAVTFAVRLSVDGDDLDTTVESVRAGEEREVAFENVQLKRGQHTLKAVADPDHAVHESKDDNNEFKVGARCTDAA